METTHERLADAVKSFDLQRLTDLASAKSGMTYMELIHGIVDHTLYHTAELQLLKKLAKLTLAE